MKKQIEYIENCTGCSACMSSCPNKAITIIKDEYGFAFPRIDSDKCIDCFLCDKVCIKDSFEDCDNRICAWYGWHKDKDIRNNSSSGGAFSALAQSVLDHNGVIFACSFDVEKKEAHIISTKDDISLLTKSKYVDSFVGNAFLLIKEFLDNNIFVMFCGTPCQTAGLINFLQKDYKNLLTCDFLCHGVSSSELLKKHLEYLEGKYKGKVTKCDFRPKTFGWSTHAIEIEFDNGKKYSKEATLDTYFYGDISTELFLKNSCYSCQYRYSHQSDITLGDFWGVYKYKAEINDDRGISLLVANTEKGKSHIKNKIHNFYLNELELKYTDYAFYKLDQSKALQKIERKNDFLSLVNKVGFEKAAKKTYMRNIFVRFIKSKIKKIWRNIR